MVSLPVIQPSRQADRGDQVDTESARELLKEATKLGSVEALEDIGARLERKAQVFFSVLGPQVIAQLDRQGLDRVFATIFSLRTRRRRLLAELDLDRARTALVELLHGSARLAARVDDFGVYARSTLGLDDRRARALTGELLHFTFPERYWLWTWWIWDPDKQKGVLELLTRERPDLAADTDGGCYEKVGRITAMVTVDGIGAGYARMGRGLLGADVFLACAQAVYVFTVYRMRISQEFNRFLPELPELARRLLGVQHIEGSA